MIALKSKHLKALKRAIEEAATWRGSMVGNPNTSNLKEFDRFIATAQEAFEIIKKENNEKSETVNTISIKSYLSKTQTAFQWQSLRH